jgi:hypothetical protein
MAWMAPVDHSAQPRYTQNEEWKLWPSYKGENDWQICQLVPRMANDERGVGESITYNFIAIEACLLLMIREGEVGMVSMTDNAAMGYYVVKWTSKPH